MLKNKKERELYLKKWNEETDIDPELIRVYTTPIKTGTSALRIDMLSDCYKYSIDNGKMETERRYKTVYMGLIDDFGVVKPGGSTSESQLVQLLTDSRDDELTKSLTVDESKVE